MVNIDEFEWLSREFPGLNVVSEGVEGPVTFTANWDGDRSGREFILWPSPEEETTGETLTVTYSIRISPTREDSASRLPELNIVGLGACLDRHLQQPSGTACLISPLEEGPFLRPDFSFRVFFEQLILPFLYGQRFYELHERWPWGEYSHGLAGVLESYGRLKSFAEEVTTECLRQLHREPSAWEKIRAFLQSFDEIIGFERCFCSKHCRLKDCHPEALFGLKQLRRNLKAAPHLRVMLANGPSFQLNRASRRRAQRDKLRK